MGICVMPISIASVQHGAEGLSVSMAKNHCNSNKFVSFIPPLCLQKENTLWRSQTPMDMVSGHGSDGLMVGPDDLSGFFQPHTVIDFQGSPMHCCFELSLCALVVFQLFLGAPCLWKRQ